MIMTQSTEITHTANGTTRVFAFNFFAMPGTLRMSVGDAEVPTSGFSATGYESNTGGEVTLPTPPASGAKVRIWRETTAEQGYDFQYNAHMPSRVIGGALDRIISIIQEMASKIKALFKRVDEIQLVPGPPGKTPHIGENGNWWVGDVDTGVNASNGKDGKDGEDGQTPSIGENGNWWIGITDTGVKARGTDGASGKTPSITVDAATLAPGSDAAATRSGTDENPHIKFEIPRGTEGPPGGTPDYANMELSINRITTDGGSWAVDRDGFVYIGGSVTGACSQTVRINGRPVHSFYTDSSSAIWHDGMHVTLPVNAGDVVLYEVSNGGFVSCSCYYVPMRASGGPASSLPAAETNDLLVNVSGNQWKGRPVFSERHTAPAASLNSASETEAVFSDLITLSKGLNFSSADFAPGSEGEVQYTIKTVRYADGTSHSPEGGDEDFTIIPYGFDDRRVSWFITAESFAALGVDVNRSVSGLVVQVSGLPAWPLTISHPDATVIPPAVPIDNNTLKVNEKGELYAVGGTQVLLAANADDAARIEAEHPDALIVW